MEIKIKEKGRKMAGEAWGGQRMKYKSVRERSIAVAANFPNFANKLPETKILKRIVKVLTSSSRTLAIYPRVPFSPPSLIAFISSSIPEKTIFYLSPPRSSLLVILSLLFLYSLLTHIIDDKMILSLLVLSSRRRFPKGKEKTLKREHA